MIEDTLALVAAALALATLPGTAELALLTIAGLLPARRPGPGPAGGALRLVSVVPAHDEESDIARCVESLRACEEPGDLFQIVVVADNCSDATAARARDAGARVLERSDRSHPGKGQALAWAFERVLAEPVDAVLVVDADTVVEPGLTAALRRRFAAGASAVQCRYGVRNPDASLRTRLQNVALLAFNVLRPRGRERLGLSAGILGNGFAVSRDALRAVPWDAHSVVEDLEYHLRLVRSGRRVRFADEATVRASMPPGGRGARTQRARWEGGRLRMMREAAPRLAVEVLRGRLRLLEPLLELLLLPLAFHVVALLAVLVLPWPPGRAYALAGLGVVAAHVLAAVAVGGGGRRDLAALLAAPFYVVWKIGLAPAIARASRREARWIRTERS